MASKQGKSVKNLKKQLSKLNAKVKKMSKKIKSLEDAVNSNAGGQSADELAKAIGEETWSGSNFTAAELESATELTEDAEEVADILEKKS